MAEIGTRLEKALAQSRRPDLPWSTLVFLGDGGPRSTVGACPGQQMPQRDGPCGGTGPRTHSRSLRCGAPFMRRACVIASTCGRFRNFVALQTLSSRAPRWPCSLTGASGMRVRLITLSRRLTSTTGDRRSNATGRETWRRLGGLRVRGGLCCAFGSTTRLKRSCRKYAASFVPRKLRTRLAE